MNRLIVESLKRLYRDGKVLEEKIQELLNKCTITEEESIYILSDSKNGDSEESVEC